MLEPLEDTRAYALERETRVTLLDILIILVQRRWIWISSAVIGCLLALILSLMLPVEYRAETDILPPQRPVSSASMLMGQVGSILGVGGSSVFGAKDPNDIFLSLLRSRTIAEALVKRFNLQQVYKRKDIFLAESELAKHSTIASTLEGTIVVKVDDRDPTRAAAIANGYIDELNKQNNRLAISEASQRRLFFQSQLESEKNALEDAEVALKETELKTGVLELPGQTELAIRQVADFRAQITNADLEMQNLLTSETTSNPDVVRLQERIRTLKADLQRVQSDNSGNTKAVDLGTLTTSTVPTLAIEYVRKLREVKYHEELFNMLSRQFEAAKIDEAKEAPAIEAIDAAVPPHFKYSPRRKLIFIAGLALGLILGWIYTVTAEMVVRSLREPEYASKWLTLQRAIRGSQRL